MSAAPDLGRERQVEMPQAQDGLLRHSAYRKELDGLRAIAVLAVVLFHVGFHDMPGGFIGVDVFFVLSGYLICGQTYMRLEAGSYSVSEFFARRIRRLSTAYFLCFLVTALAANAFFLRSEMQVVVDGFLGSVTFTNNINLMSSAGYFAAPAEENPYLHTWSLSIEEQFYIVLPMLIVLTRRSRRVFAGVLAGLFVLSLGLTLFSGDWLHDRDARFFASLFRVWELAAGGLVFVLGHHRLLPSKLPLAAPAGLLMVLLPVNLLDGGALYPGAATLWPVLGTVLLIAFADPRHSLVGRVLATAPMAYVGRISYGTYLWHWPLIVGVIYAGVEMRDEVRALLLLVALGLGALSSHLVETPVRRLSARDDKRRLYALFAGQLVVLLAIGGWLAGQPGKAGQGEDRALAALKAEIGNAHDRWDTCWNRTAPDRLCRLGAPGERPGFLLWGDSMANSALPAFDGYGLARKEAGRLATAPGCAPLDGIGPKAPCLEFNRAILDYLRRAPAMDVFLMARWPYYSEGYANRGTRPGEVPLLRADGSRVAENFPAFEAGLARVLAAISRRHRVILVGVVPEYPFSVPKAMLRARRFGTPPRAQTRAAFEARSGRTMAALKRMAQRFGARLIAPQQVFCDARICDYQRDGKPLFFDNVHLGRHGNQVLQALLIAEMAKREGMR